MDTFKSDVIEVYHLANAKQDLASYRV